MLQDGLPLNLGEPFRPRRFRLRRPQMAFPPQAGEGAGRLAAGGVVRTGRNTGDKIAGATAVSWNLLPTILPENQGLWWRRWRPTLYYLAQTEAHVYALAIAASVLLSAYPF